MDSIQLMGSEAVERAGSRMVEAAQSIKSSVYQLDALLGVWVKGKMMSKKPKLAQVDRYDCQENDNHLHGKSDGDDLYELWVSNCLDKEHIVIGFKDLTTALGQWGYCLLKEQTMKEWVREYEKIWEKIQAASGVWVRGGSGGPR